MKVYSLPEELKATLPDIFSKNWIEEERQHRLMVKDWFIENGYTGKNTGRIYQTPVADGYAEYMVVEGPGIRSFLVHLPYCDGYHDKDVEYIPKKEILARIKGREEIGKIFGAKS